MTKIEETKLKSGLTRINVLSRKLKAQLETEHKLIGEHEKLKENYEQAMHRVSQLEDECGCLESTNADLNLKLEQLEAKLAAALNGEPDCWRITAPTFCGHVSVDKTQAQFWLDRGQAYPLFSHVDAARPIDYKGNPRFIAGYDAGFRDGRASWSKQKPVGYIRGTSALFALNQGHPVQCFPGDFFSFEHEKNDNPLIAVYAPVTTAGE